MCESINIKGINQQNEQYTVPVKRIPTQKGVTQDFFFYTIHCDIRGNLLRTFNGKRQDLSLNKVCILE